MFGWLNLELNLELELELNLELNLELELELELNLELEIAGYVNIISQSWISAAPTMLGMME